MIQVPSYEEFQRLAADVAILKEENDFLRTVVLARRLLTRYQTLKVLGVSETTLWRLTKSKMLISDKEGRKIGYDIESIRTYLTTKKLSTKVAENRIIQALYNG